MIENPLQRTLEDRWLELASSLTRAADSREQEIMRHVFYAGAASAWRMSASGDSQQLERDVLGYIALELSDLKAKAKDHGE